MDQKVRIDTNALIFTSANSGAEIDVSRDRISDLIVFADPNNTGVLPATTASVNGMPVYPGAFFSPDAKEGEVFVSKFVIKVPTAGDIVYVLRKVKMT